MGRNYLFVKESLSATLEGHAHGLDDEIEKAPEKHLLQVDEDEWVRALVARYAVEAPELRPEDWWMDPAEEIKMSLRSSNKMRRDGRR